MERQDKLNIYRSAKTERTGEREMVILSDEMSNLGSDEMRNRSFNDLYRRHYGALCDGTVYFCIHADTIFFYRYHIRAFPFF